MAEEKKPRKVSKQPGKTSKNLQKPPTKTRLTPLQMRAIELLAQGDKRIVVAEQLDVSINTIYLWLEKPEFVAALDKLINASSEQALRNIQTLKEKAVSVLKELLDDKNTPPAVLAQISFKLIDIPSPTKLEPTVPKTVPPEVLKEKTEEIYGI